jgi:hypothetical protein
LAGDLVFSVRDGPALVVFSLYFMNNSPMLAVRSARGIRLTRISIRDRRPCAWSIYCARSFLARSVTITTISMCLDLQKASSTYSPTANYRSKLASAQL